MGGGTIGPAHDMNQAPGGGSLTLSGQGGFGAQITGNFMLTQGEIIEILVGQPGLWGSHTQSTGSGTMVGGGGGGSFVLRAPYNANTSILAIAGGGGGAVWGGNNQNASSPSTRAGISATIPYGLGPIPGVNGPAGLGGVNGGFAYNVAYGSAAGGSGFFTNFNSATIEGNNYSYNYEPPLHYIASGGIERSPTPQNSEAGRGGNGFVAWGGSATFPFVTGGFGGGGGAGLVGGGGGGYNGGGPGSWAQQGGGGGGGSYTHYGATSTVFGLYETHFNNQFFSYQPQTTLRPLSASIGGEVHIRFVS